MPTLIAYLGKSEGCFVDKQWKSAENNCVLAAQQVMIDEGQHPCILGALSSRQGRPRTNPMFGAFTVVSADVTRAYSVSRAFEPTGLSAIWSSVPCAFPNTVI